MPILVRPATEADVASVLDVAGECETAPRWAEAEYRRIVVGASCLKRCLMVALDGRVLGGFAVGSVAAGIGQLESVAVRPAWQRQGVGHALCRGVLEWCSAQGAEVVELEVRAGSEGARKLYERLGFEVAGQRPRYYEAPADDAILMRLRRPSRPAILERL